jgi:hypothetical protein
VVSGEWRIGANQKSENGKQKTESGQLSGRNFFTKVNEGNEAELKNGSENFNRRGHRDRRVEDMTTDDSDFADERQNFFTKGNEVNEGKMNFTADDADKRGCIINRELMTGE